MPRKPAKERNPIPGATPARDYELGDEVLFSFAGTAGEALFIGQLRKMRPAWSWRHRRKIRALKCRPLWADKRIVAGYYPPLTDFKRKSSKR